MLAGWVGGWLVGSLGENEGVLVDWLAPHFLVLGSFFGWIEIYCVGIYWHLLCRHLYWHSLCRYLDHASILASVGSHILPQDG